MVDQDSKIYIYSMPPSTVQKNLSFWQMVGGELTGHYPQELTEQ